MVSSTTTRKEEKEKRADMSRGRLGAGGVGEGCARGRLGLFGIACTALPEAVGRLQAANGHQAAHAG